MNNPQCFTIKIKDVLSTAPQRSILGPFLLGDFVNNMDGRRVSGHIRKTQISKALEVHWRMGLAFRIVLANWESG